eukprot:7076921-Prymnesium_polylepis.1
MSVGSCSWSTCNASPTPVLPTPDPTSRRSAAGGVSCVRPASTPPARPAASRALQDAFAPRPRQASPTPRRWGWIRSPCSDGRQRGLCGGRPRAS